MTLGQREKESHAYKQHGARYDDANILISLPEQANRAPRGMSRDVVLCVNIYIYYMYETHGAFSLVVFVWQLATRARLCSIAGRWWRRTALSRIPTIVCMCMYMYVANTIHSALTRARQLAYMREHTYTYYVRKRVERESERESNNNHQV